MRDFRSWEPYVLSLLRLIVGLLFFEHGLSKLFNFPPGNLHPGAFELLWFAGVIETIGGLLVALGLFTRAAAFITSGEMAIAYFLRHEPRSPFPLINGGEGAVLFCFLFFYLFIAGGGAWSVDRLLNANRPR
jgi:putative oxidoreductase